MDRGKLLSLDQAGWDRGGELNDSKPRKTFSKTFPIKTKIKFTLSMP